MRRAQSGRRLTRAALLWPAMALVVQATPQLTRITRALPPMSSRAGRVDAEHLGAAHWNAACRPPARSSRADPATRRRSPNCDNSAMNDPGNLFCVAAPSGTGKSSLVKALLELDSHLVVSVSHTTRAPRGQDVDGREYWFVDEPTFRGMAERGEFLEWAQVHGHLYGTSRKGVEQRLAQGQDVMLEIDWQGALQIRQLFPCAVLIFILPPSWDELRQRLERRGQDRPEVIATRLANAREEVAQAAHFDFVIINSLFETALFDLKTIVHSQRLRYAAQRRTRSQVFAALDLA